MATITPEYIASPAQLATDGGYIDRPYEPDGCWNLVRDLYRDGLGIDLPESHIRAAPQFVEVWFDEAGAAPIEDILQPWDVIIYKVPSRTVQHVGMIASRTEIIHTRANRGAAIDLLRLWQSRILQVCRHETLTDFADIPRNPIADRTDFSKPDAFGVRMLVSPVTAIDGSLRFKRIGFDPGKPLRDYFEPGVVVAEVLRNSIRVPVEVWDDMIPQEGEDWVLIPQWGEAATVTAIIIEIVVAIAVSLAVSYLFAPPDANIRSADPSFSADGIQSTRGPGQPIPVGYGRRRVGLHYLQRFTSNRNTFVDDGTGLTTFSILDVTGGTRGNDDDDGVAVTIQTTAPHGFQHSQKVLISGIEGTGNLRSVLNKKWIITTVTTDTFELLFSNGLKGSDVYTANTGTVDIGQELRVIELTDDTSKFHFLGSLGQGEIEEIEIDTLEINGQPLGNFPDINTDITKLGTAGQTPLTGFGDVRNTIASGLELIEQAEGHDYTTQSAVTGFGLNLEWRGGLYHVGGGGSIVGNVVTVTYKYRVNNPQGAWSTAVPFQARGSKTGTVRMGIEQTGLALDTYDINIVVSDPRWNNPGDQWIPHLSGVTHITDNVQAYPNWALLGGSFQFNPQVQGSFPNITVVKKGVKVRIGSFGATPAYSANPAWCLMDYMTNTRYGMGIPDAGIDLPAFQTFADYCDEDVSGRPRHVMALELDTRVSQQRVFEVMLQSSRTELIYLYGKWAPRVTRNDPASYVFSWSNVRNFDLSMIRDPNTINVIQTQFLNEDNNFEEEVYEYPEAVAQSAEVFAESIELRGVTNPVEVAAFSKISLGLFQLPAFSFSFEAPPEAILVQKHMVIGISHDVMGWGVAGRVMPDAGNSTTSFKVDQDITIDGGKSYHVYVMFPDGSYEVKFLDTAVGTHDNIVVNVASPFSQVPTDEDTRWVLGENSPVNTAIKLGRVEDVVLLKDGWVRLSGVHHNSFVYGNEPPGPVLPTSNLPRLQGPPPPIVSATAVENLQSLGTGARQSVVLLSWDIGAQGRYAPYGGAIILRREILQGGLAGNIQTAIATFAEDMNPLDELTGGYSRIGFTQGFNYSDSTVIPGLTYEYRIIPVSGINTPNNVGYYNIILHVHGGAATEFAPGPPQNVQLFVKNEAGTFVEAGLADDGLFDTGSVEYIGEDVQFRWGAPAGFEEGQAVLFVNRYRVQVWTGTGSALLHEDIVTSKSFNYPKSLNLDDSIRIGFTYPHRAIVFRVWAISNVDVESSTYAQLAILNQAVDMSSHTPVVRPLLSAAQLDWSAFNPPTDIDRYDILLETTSPPNTVYKTIDGKATKTELTDLDSALTYFVRMRAYDPFGLSPVALWTPTVSFMPNGLGAGQLDALPPSVPTGVTLTAGAEIQADGAQISFVDINWDASTDPEGSDVHYQVNYRFGAVPTERLYTIGSVEGTSYRISPVPGLTEVGVSIAASDRIRNVSDFSAEVIIQTAGDATPPGDVTSLSANGYLRTIILNFIPPSDADLSHVEVHASLTNDRSNSFLSGRAAANTSFYNFNVDAGNSTLNNNEEWFFWVRPVDTSGNLGGFFPTGATAGVSGTTSDPGLDPITGSDIVDRTVTGIKIALAENEGIKGENIVTGEILADHIAAGQIDAIHITAGGITSGWLSTSELITTSAQIADATIVDAHITDLTAAKLTAGNITADLTLGVGTFLKISGSLERIGAFDAQDPPVLRVAMGNLGVGNTAWGLRVWDENGVLQFDTIAGGVSAAGIQTGVVNASHIETDTITADHIQSGVLIITDVAQIDDEIVETSHIKDLTVDTIKIANGAITGFVGAETVHTATSVPVGPLFDPVVSIVVPAISAGEHLQITAVVSCRVSTESGSTTFLQFHIRDETGIQDTRVVGTHDWIESECTLMYNEVVGVGRGSETWKVTALAFGGGTSTHLLLQTAQMRVVVTKK